MKLAIIGVMLLVSLESAAQSNGCDSIYTFVDQMPLYKGGISDFYTDFGKIKSGCRPEDLTMVSWIIDKEGQMIDIEVRVLEDQCGPPIVKQLETFPKWAPGKHRGQEVCVRMVMPVHVRGSR